MPHAVLEATNRFGVLAPWRFTIVALRTSRLPDVPYAITLVPRAAPAEPLTATSMTDRAARSCPLSRGYRWPRTGVAAASVFGGQRFKRRHW